MTQPQRSLVIPVYRETTRIGGSLARLAMSELSSPETEIIIVDDGSDDATVQIVHEAMETSGLRGRVIRRGLHLGKGSAVRVGLLAARGKVVVFTDADLSTPIPDIAACFALLERDEADVVYADRAHEGSRIDTHAPAHRVVAGRAFNFLLRALALTDALDTQCGMKGFRAEAAHAIGAELRTDGFAFDVEILARANRAGMRVVSFPVRWSHVEASRVRPIRDGLAMALDALWIRGRLVGPGHSRSGVDQAGMSDEDVEALAAQEVAHWWFKAKRELVEASLADLRPEARIVDVGAGGGALVSELASSGRRAWAVDLSPVSARRSRDRHSSATGLVADAARLPFRPGSLDAICSLDVVEHLDDDIEALRGYWGALRPGGRLIVTVPAYEWAWSRHDAQLGHRRRYAAGRLNEALTVAGFAVDRVTYFHTWLVPAAAAVRRTPLGRLVDDQQQASDGGPVAGRLLDAVTGIERRLLERVDLPFGLSLLSVAHRPN